MARGLPEWVPLAEIMDFAVTSPPPNPDGSVNHDEHTEIQHISTWLECGKLANIPTLLSKEAYEAGVRIQIRTERRLIRETVFFDAWGTGQQLRTFRDRVEMGLHKEPHPYYLGTKHPGNWFTFPSATLGPLDRLV